MAIVTVGVGKRNGGAPLFVERWTSMARSFFTSKTGGGAAMRSTSSSTTMTGGLLARDMSAELVGHAGNKVTSV